jgi:hypothetical protein
VKFPEYFTASSPYLQILDPSSYTILRDEFEGKNGKIPLTVYGTNASNVKRAMQQTREVFKELEDTYGPYAHASFTAKITNSGGGMEYAGATQSSMAALSHEITHSWFARGVMPSSGNSGWIDEAIASWRDNGYPRASSVALNGSFPALASFSKYRRDTTQDAYSHGARVMSELDLLLKDAGGLRPVLAALYNAHAKETITTGLFLKWVNQFSATPLDEYFRKKVYDGEDPAFAHRSKIVPASDWFIRHAW